MDVASFKIVLHTVQTEDRVSGICVFCNGIKKFLVHSVLKYTLAYTLNGVLFGKWVLVVSLVSDFNKIKRLIATDNEV